MPIIVPQSVTLMAITPDAAKTIERAGRVCYKSEDRICDGSDAKLIANLIKREHFSVLEHASATFLLTTDRGITHELVRHRIASFSQESTRYVNYGNKGGEITVVEPLGLNDVQRTRWLEAMIAAEAAYLAMLDKGCAPQVARDVLPTCTKADIVLTANFREMLHIIKLRTAPAAHPKIRVLIGLVHDELKKACPEVFGNT